MELCEKEVRRQIQRYLQKNKVSDFNRETTRWKEMIKNMHFPFDEKRNVFLQQDGFLDKEINTG